MEKHRQSTLPLAIALLLAFILPLLACTQTTPIQTLKVANNTTAFGTNLPAGTYIFDSETKKPYQLKKAASSTNTLLTPYLAIGLLVDSGLNVLETNYLQVSDSNYLNLSGNIFKTGGSGDVNNSGDISATDALYIKYMVNTAANVSELTGIGNYQTMWARGDIDGDGTVSYLESYIIQLMVGGDGLNFTYDSLKLMSRKLKSNSIKLTANDNMPVLPTWEEHLNNFNVAIGTGSPSEPNATTLIIDHSGNTAIKAEPDTNYSLKVTGNILADSLEVAGNIFQSNTGNSVFIGEDAGATDDGTNNKNIFIGYLTGALNTSGAYNVGIGNQALYNNLTGSSNTAIGSGALTDNDDGTGNTAIGINTLYQNTAGINNTAIGTQSGMANSIGDNNTSLGYRSLYSTIGGNNTAIGAEAGLNCINGTDNVFLGYQAGYNENTSNKLYIDNSSTATPLIYGDFNLDEITINGDFTVNGQYHISALNTAPSSATDTGTLGEIRITATAIYICTATDTWVKADLTTW